MDFPLLTTPPARAINASATKMSPVEAPKTEEQQPEKRNFISLLEKRQIAANTLLCVGLDSDSSKLPAGYQYFINRERTTRLEGIRVSLQEFNHSIILATADLVCAYKPNIAFYEEHGNAGLDALLWTTEFIKKEFPDIPIILDAKRTDIGNTNLPYARMAFDYFGADAITVNPYFGGEAIQPFLDRKDKGIIVLCRTSNPGAREFQDLLIPLIDLPIEARKFFTNPDLGIAIGQSKSGIAAISLYQWVAYQAAHEWNKNGHVCLVVGATYPEELVQVRKIVGEMPILVPGLGAQGGKPEDIAPALNSQKRGIIANNARGIIFAQPQEGETSAQAARREALKWRDAINQYR